MVFPTLLTYQWSHHVVYKCSDHLTTGLSFPANAGSGQRVMPLSVSPPAAAPGRETKDYQSRRLHQEAPRVIWGKNNKANVLVKFVKNLHTRLISLCGYSARVPIATLCINTFTFRARERKARLNMLGTQILTPSYTHTPATHTYPNIQLGVAC